MRSTFSTTPIELVFPLPDFDFKNCSARYWNDKSEAKSHFWNALSSLLPNAEFCAIVGIITIIPTIGDEKLKIETTQFCKQESTHGNTHTNFNAQHLHTNYPYLKNIESWERKMFMFFHKHFSRKAYLSLFVAIEHLTAAFSHHGLGNPLYWFSNCDPTMFKLWEWHAVEELAHKSVCYDIHRYIGGNYFSKTIGMATLLIFIILPGMTMRLTYFFFKDGILFNPAKHLDLLFYLLGQHGVITRIFRDFIKYFNPNYQPWDTDSLPQISAYKQRHPI